MILSSQYKKSNKMEIKKLGLVWISALLLLSSNANAAGGGSCLVQQPFVGAELLSSTCYSCMLPLKIAAVPIAVGPMPDFSPDESNIPVCVCPMPPPIFVRIGIPISFFNPTRVIEPVTSPLCFPSLGVSMSDVVPPGMLAGGDATKTKDGAPRTFYQSHELIFPIMGILQVMVDVACMENSDIDVAYLTEVDPLWNVDSLGVFLTPEAILFGNPIAALACVADAVSSQVFFPLDPLFWCKGSHGMAYPMTGNIGSKGMVEDSASAAENMIYGMHRRGLGTHDSMCYKIPTPIWKKSDYRLQIVKPIPHPIGFGIGQSGLVWDMAKNPPMIGDNFVYLRFKKLNCCVF
jgi:conjugal transfer pilus assembly protein TraU